MFSYTPFRSLRLPEQLRLRVYGNLLPLLNSYNFNGLKAKFHFQSPLRGKSMNQYQNNNDFKKIQSILE